MADRLLGVVLSLGLSVCEGVVPNGEPGGSLVEEGRAQGLELAVPLAAGWLAGT